MIPVPVFSYVFLILLLLSVISLPVLVCWVVLICVSRRRRSAFRARWRLNLSLMVLLAFLSSFVLLMVYEFHRIDVESEQREAARYTVLQQPQTIGDIQMPAGTRLHSLQPGQLESFDTATFPQPFLFNGLVVSSLDRSIYEDMERGFVVSSIDATLASDQTVAGWICQKQLPVKFDVASGSLVFRYCTLAAGNLVGNWPIPAGAEVLADGQYEQAWTVYLNSGTSTLVSDIPLQKVRLALDKNHQALGFSEAALAKDLRLGSVFYTEGTRVNTKDWALPSKLSDTLIFTPLEGQVAKIDGGQDVPFGSSVVQTLAGDVQAIQSNQEAGVVHIDPFFLVK